MTPRRLELLFADVLHEVGNPWDFKVLGQAESPGCFQATLDGAEIVVVWLSSGWPRQVHELFERSTRLDLVAAPKFSPGARKLLTANKVPWFDGTGAARICTPSMRVLVDPNRVLTAEQTAAFQNLCEYMKGA